MGILKEIKPKGALTMLNELEREHLKPLGSLMPYDKSSCAECERSIFLERVDSRERSCRDEPYHRKHGE